MRQSREIVGGAEGYFRESRTMACKYGWSAILHQGVKGNDIFSCFPVGLYFLAALHVSRKVGASKISFGRYKLESVLTSMAPFL